MARRADRIRDKLGWETGILNSPGEKPKEMHWKTFENRLRCIPIPCYECVQCDTNPYRAGLHQCSCLHWNFHG